LFEEGDEVLDGMSIGNIDTRKGTYTIKGLERLLFLASATSLFTGYS
jgi:hypothetical protein